MFENTKSACSAAIGYSNKICFFIGHQKSLPFWLLQREIFMKSDLHFYWLLNMFAQRRSAIGQQQ